MDMKRVVKNAAQMVGIAKLRKPQVKPINDILEGRDTMVVARPSAGKSAIYQIPALVHGEERTIVIEPLLSLMHDQVRKLREHGVGAARLDSTMKKSEQKECLQKFIRGEVKMLFITPERFIKEEFLLHDEGGGGLHGRRGRMSCRAGLGVFLPRCLFKYRTSY